MKISCAFAIVAFSLLWVASATAAISPERIKKMRAECGEQLEVKITSVAEGASTARALSTRTSITYRATVVKTDRSKSGLKPGDEIAINSYIVGGLIEPGPMAPSKLKTGWQGVVYLNHAEGDKYNIAVFGHSFVEKAKE